jgi:nucleoside-diphosphate-sugar epimerase
MTTRNETALVTGAGGYIGSVLVGELLSRGFAVRALDRFFFGEETLAEYRGNGALKCLKKDIRDLSAEDLEGVQVVFDLAALSNDPSGDLHPDLTRAINHQARVRVARIAREVGVGRYLLASSCSVYGGGGDGNMATEKGSARPLTVYAEANLAAENDSLPLGSGGFCVTALRNATVFGVSPRMRFDLVINLMTLHAFELGRITVMGGGRQWRPLIHVRDVAAAFIAVATAPQNAVAGQVFNVGLGNYQVRTIAAIVREVLPFAVDIQIAPDDADKRNYQVSFDKLADATGYRPQLTIEDGIREVYEALKFGRVENTPKCSTVGWYRSILEAKRLVDTIELEGRIL